jgi:hypothetical protein
MKYFAGLICVCVSAPVFAQAIAFGDFFHDAGRRARRDLFWQHGRQLVRHQLACPIIWRMRPGANCVADRFPYLCKGGI